MKFVEGNGQDLSDFLQSKQKETENWLEVSGAILFRGFHIEEGLEIDDLARKLDYTPFDTYIPGIAPRKAYKNGNSSVFTSTEAPPHLPILPHTGKHSFFMKNFFQKSCFKATCLQKSSFLQNILLLLFS